MSRPVTPRETLRRCPEPVLARSACFVGFFFPLFVRPVRRSLLAFLSLVSTLLLLLLSLVLFSPLLWSGRGLFLGLSVLGVFGLCDVLSFHGPVPCSFSGGVVVAGRFTALSRWPCPLLNIKIA